MKKMLLFALVVSGAILLHIDKSQAYTRMPHWVGRKAVVSQPSNEPASNEPASN